MLASRDYPRGRRPQVDLRHEPAVLGQPDGVAADTLGRFEPRPRAPAGHGDPGARHGFEHIPRVGSELADGLPMPRLPARERPAQRAAQSLRLRLCRFLQKGEWSRDEGNGQIPLAASRVQLAAPAVRHPRLDTILDTASPRAVRPHTQNARRLERQPPTRDARARLQRRGPLQLGHLRARTLLPGYHGQPYRAAARGQPVHQRTAVVASQSDRPNRRVPPGRAHPLACTRPPA